MDLGIFELTVLVVELKDFYLWHRWKAEEDSVLPEVLGLLSSGTETLSAICRCKNPPAYNAIPQ